MGKGGPPHPLSTPPLSLRMRGQTFKRCPVWLGALCNSVPSSEKCPPAQSLLNSALAASSTAQPGLSPWAEPLAEPPKGLPGEASPRQLPTCPFSDSSEPKGDKPRSLCSCPFTAQGIDPCSTKNESNSQRLMLTAAVITPTVTAELPILLHDTHSAFAHPVPQPERPDLEDSHSTHQHPSVLRGAQCGGGRME